MHQPVLAGQHHAAAALAARIVAYRAENGPFETPEDLMEVSGIGQKKLEDIRDRVTVSGGG